MPVGKLGFLLPEHILGAGKVGTRKEFAPRPPTNREDVIELMQHLGGLFGGVLWYRKCFLVLEKGFVVVRIHQVEGCRVEYQKIRDACDLLYTHLMRIPPPFEIPPKSQYLTPFFLRISIQWQSPCKPRAFHLYEAGHPFRLRVVQL